MSSPNATLLIPIQSNENVCSLSAKGQKGEELSLVREYFFKGFWVSYLELLCRVFFMFSKFG